MAPDSDLELQIVSFATAWASFTQFGAINVHTIRVELPTTADATREFATPVSAQQRSWDARGTRPRLRQRADQRLLRAEGDRRTW
jgi:hypothetical protein